MTDIVTVTLNPAMDVSTSVRLLIPNHKLRCAPARRDAGGGGINVARVIRRFGGEVTAVYPAGGRAGALLRQLLREEKVASRVILTREETRENFHVFEEETKQQYKFELPGPHLSQSAWRRCRSAVRAESQGARYLICSGSLPPGAPEDVYAQLAKRAKRARVRFVVDSSGPALRAALKEGVYLAKPSLRELCELTGRALEDEASWAEACRKLIAAEAAAVVALTLGERGALIVTRDATLRADAPQIAAVSSIGAGDSFLAALVWSLGQNLSLAEALKLAVAAGAAALLAPGTELCLQKDIERLKLAVRVAQL